MGLANEAAAFCLCDVVGTGQGCWAPSPLCPVVRGRRKAAMCNPAGSTSLRTFSPCPPGNSTEARGPRKQPEVKDFKERAAQPLATGGSHHNSDRPSGGVYTKILFASDEHSMTNKAINSLKARKLAQLLLGWGVEQAAALGKPPVPWRQCAPCTKAASERRGGAMGADLGSLKGGTVTEWGRPRLSHRSEMDGVRLPAVLWLGNPAPSREVGLGVFHAQTHFTSHIFPVFPNQAFHAPGDCETNEAEKSLSSQLLQSNPQSRRFMECGRGRCSFCWKSKPLGLKL